VQPRERRHPGFVEVITEDVAEVGPRRFRILDDSGSPCEGISWRPHPPARPGRCAAEHGLLFGNDDLEAVEGGGDRGRQGTGSGARDQYVAFRPGLALTRKFAGALFMRHESVD
jgi:hypothetical protein